MRHFSTQGCSIRQAAERRMTAAEAFRCTLRAHGGQELLTKASDGHLGQHSFTQPEPTPMSISLSNRPKRRRAASMLLGRLVAPMTMTWERDLSPSINVSS